MKKRGFTLSEVLVTLGIIGIISAILIPSLGKARPDKTKLLYLKAYDSLTEAVNTLITDSSIYGPLFVSNAVKDPTPTSPCTMQSDGTHCTYQYLKNEYNVESYPLLNFAKPINSRYNDSIYSGNYKFANLIKTMFDGTGQACSSGSCEFTTKHNISWTITPSNESNTLNSTNIAPTQAEFYNTIQTTINNEEFTFYVLANGSVIPSDTKGQAYIKYRKNPRMKDSDTANLSAKNLSDLPHRTMSIGTNQNPAPDIEKLSTTVDRTEDELQSAPDINIQGAEH